MSRPADRCVILSSTLTLCEFDTGGDKGFWLYDKTRGMNLSMCAKTSTDAFVEALEYYQERLLQVEAELKSINARVDAFVALVRPEEEREWT